MHSAGCRDKDRITIYRFPVLLSAYKKVCVSVDVSVSVYVSVNVGVCVSACVTFHFNKKKKTFLCIFYGIIQCYLGNNITGSTK